MGDTKRILFAHLSLANHKRDFLAQPCHLHSCWLSALQFSATLERSTLIACCINSLRDIHLFSLASSQLRKIHGTLTSMMFTYPQRIRVIAGHVTWKVGQSKQGHVLWECMFETWREKMALLMATKTNLMHYNTSTRMCFMQWTYFWHVMTKSCIRSLVTSILTSCLLLSIFGNLSDRLSQHWYYCWTTQIGRWFVVLVFLDLINVAKCH